MVSGSKTPFKITLERRISLAALVPLVGYLAAYMFEYGYLNTFGISYDVIQVDIGQVIIAIIVSGIVLYYLLDLVSSGRSALSEFFAKRGEQAVFWRHFIFTLTVAIVSLLFAMLTKNSVFGVFCLFILVAFTTVLIVYYFIPALAAIFSDRSITKGIATHMRRRTIELQTTSSEKLEHKHYVGAALLITLSFSLLAYIGGYGVATMKKTFVVLGTKNHTQTVLIRQYGDMLITKKYNNQTNAFKPGYTIIKITDHQSFKTEHLKPLKLN